VRAMLHVGKLPVPPDTWTMQFPVSP
jgi:hypothetical protein